MTSLISSTVWVRRGVAAEHPKRYTLDENELERVAKMAGNRLEQVKEDLLRVQTQEEQAVDVDDMIAGEDDDDDDDDEEQGTGLEVMNVENENGNDREWTDEENSEKDMTMDLDEQKVDRMTDDLAQYNLDNYDKEESKGVSMGAFSNVKGLQYYENPNDDPYVTLDALADDEQDEREELQIHPTDNLLVAAKTEDDVSQLEVYVYDESEENLYVHHDLLLPAMPLCLEWIDFTPAGSSCDDLTRKGNLVAVGTMDPDIEIWSLDVVDGLYPDAILGASGGRDQDQASESNISILAPSEPSRKSVKKKKKKKVAPSTSTPMPTISPTHHTSSVLSLSHNKLVRNLLLSSSADTTVKLWDLNVAPQSPSSTFSAIRSFNFHQDKVQSAQWNPKEASVVLSGGWDGLIKVWDSRNSTEGVQVKVESDVECLRWNPFQPHAFLVSLDNGLIQSYDSRYLPKFTDKNSKSKALWTLSAHDSSVSAMDISSAIPGLLVTGGVDKMVKVWNLDEKDGTPGISMVTSRNLDVGKVFSVGFCPNAVTTVAIAGSKASLQIWDIASNSGVRGAFADRFKQYANFDLDKRKTIGNGGVIGLTNDAESDDDDEQ